MRLHRLPGMMSTGCRGIYSTGCLHPNMLCVFTVEIFSHVDQFGSKTEVNRRERMCLNGYIFSRPSVCPVPGGPRKRNPSNASVPKELLKGVDFWVRD